MIKLISSISLAVVLSLGYVSATSFINSDANTEVAGKEKKEKKKKCCKKKEGECCKKGASEDKTTEKE